MRDHSKTTVPVFFMEIIKQLWMSVTQRLGKMQSQEWVECDQICHKNGGNSTISPRSFYNPLFAEKTTKHFPQNQKQCHRKMTSRDCVQKWRGYFKTINI